MDIFSILELLSGVALFLFGMSVMGDGLKKVAGNKLELILYKLSSTPIKGILLGTGVTGVIQSSSATSVMVVGFVNSGMMKVKQAIGVIMGAIIGTSVTGWILSLSAIDSGSSGWLKLLSTSTLTSVVAVVGILFRMVSKKQTKKYVGDILLGFSVLMMGMQIMSSSVSPLRESPVFMDILTKFSNPILGILFGMAITGVLQSASATVGILQALAITGAIDFSIALPVIMGIAIGAALPVLLSAIGSSTNGVRTAFVYLLIDVLGVIIWGTIFYSINAVVHFSFMHTTMTAASIAIVNTLFRVLTVLVLIPFIGKMEALVCTLFKEKKDDEIAELDCLEERFITHPGVAIELCQKMIYSMAQKTFKNLNRAFDLLDDYSDEAYQLIYQKEDVIDKYEDKLGGYVVQVAAYARTAENQQEVSRILHTISDFERIADHAVNVADVAKDLIDRQVSFTEEGINELKTIRNALTAIVSQTVEIMKDNSIKMCRQIEPLEELIDYYTIECKANHVRRVQQGACSFHSGFLFNDLLTDYERISDHCSNIAAALIMVEEGVYEPHKYTSNIHNKREFELHYKEYLKEFGDVK